MDDEIRAELRGMLGRILDVMDQLDGFRQQARPTLAAAAGCHKSVDDLVAAYDELFTRVPVDTQDEVTRRFGRKVIELRRKADDTLPARSAGQKVALSTENRWAPATVAAATATPAPASATPQRAAPSPRPQRRPSGPTAGADIESWCGPCKCLQFHTIIAMVDGKPKQLICNSCGSRHGFREAPVQKAPDPVDKSKRPPSREAAAKERMQAEMAALGDELDQVAEVAPFVKHRRYRVGEIIEHPEHGRGKVEHSERDILLVRFRDGRRSV